MRVSFYLPANFLPSAETRAAWAAGGRADLAAEGKVATAQAWIYRTWAALEASGADVELAAEMPREGIVIAMTSHLPASFRPPRDLFLAGVVADALPHPAAHAHIVQNSAHAKRLREAFFLPHWPQPGLVPRDPSRGERFERIAYVGHADNLAPELKDARWQECLRDKCGATFEIREPGRWHDYSDVDAVVAVRAFRGRRELHKPATKLYNSWLAGVPFIGGGESAYGSDGIPDKNYLVANSAEEVVRLAALLAGDPSLRSALAREGREAAQDFSREATLRRWRVLVSEIFPEAARRERAKGALGRALASVSRRVRVAADRRLR